MTFIQAIILGIVQGLTEFLPVSSSGHLVLLKHLFDIEEVPILFDVLLHVSTLMVVIIVFRQRILKLFISLGKFITRKNDKADANNLRLIWVIIVATALTAAVGYSVSLLEISQKPKIVSALFIVTAAILVSSYYAKGEKKYRELTWKEGAFTGLAQGLGVLPGISRSGITIAASLHAGIEREKAGEYAFLISIPAVLGALILSLNDAQALADVSSPLVVLSGIAASFIVGLASLLLLLVLVRKAKLYLFALYLVPLGIAGLIIF
jgi:undecaprenyl-diphosphatase